VTTTAIQWPKRARIVRNELTTNKHYLSACGDWEIVEVAWLHPEGYGRYILLIKHFGNRSVRQFKSRRAAEAACEE
jgi:hypothetical protein